MLKSLPKILTIFFLVIFIFQLACLIVLFAAPQTSQAADVTFTPQVQGLDYTFNSADKTTGNIANYVRAIYKYAIGIVGILAAVVLMIGGVLWIVAGGNATAIGEAKSWIGASLTGLVLALSSYLILATINPALVDLKTTTITAVQSMGCCEKDSANQGATSEDECKKNGGTWGGANSVWSEINKKCITAAENSTGCCLIGNSYSETDNSWLDCKNNIKIASCDSVLIMGSNIYKVKFGAGLKCSEKNATYGTYTACVQ